ncbi:hypothetical protein JMG10_34320 [Nostoc ellipsosporum NOK]|nr:hypothetical protein [Nostoc ellipsosporum NOK]
MNQSRAYTGQGDLPTALSDAGRMRFLVQQIMMGMATSTLAVVRAVEGETVDVQPMIAQIDGAGNTLPHGTIHGLPFVKVRAGGNVIDLIPEVGDIGLAIFCHNDISGVKKTRDVAAPGSRRRFDWADGVFIGGLLGGEATQSIRLDADGIAIEALAGKPVRIKSSVAVQVEGPVDTDTEYRVDGVKVVGNRQGAITAPSGGGTIDAQSRTAIGQLISAMQAHGLIA